MSDKEEEMKRNDDSVNEKIKELVDRNFTGLFLITGAAVLLLWVLREDDRMLFIVALLFFLTAFLVIRIINKQLLFILASLNICQGC